MFESNLGPPGVVDIARAIRAQEYSAVEILEHFLARIERLEPAHHAYIIQTPERARKHALAVDAAINRGEDVGEF